MIFGRAIIPLRFLFVRDLFRKPVPTFRDHALVPFCHSVNALGAPRDVTAPQPPVLGSISSRPSSRNASSTTGRRGAMVNNQGYSLSRTAAARRDDMACERSLIRAGQALSTMIVVPQIGLPLLLV
jgi:hypothetical protein